MHRTQTKQYAAQDSTENSTQNNAQPQHMCTYDLHKYSLDYYFEYAYIKDSNTIELYTISKE